jgi:hypothetical protein
MLLLGIGLALLALAVGLAVFLARYPADKPLPVDRDLRPFSPPELAAMQVPQLVFAAGLGGFGCWSSE